MYSTRSLKEYSFLFFLFFLFFVSLTNLFNKIYIIQFVDTSFLLELIGSTGDLFNFELNSYILGSVVEASKTWTMSAFDVCNSLTANYKTYYNVLENHAYINIFLFQSLANFLSPSLILSIFHSFSFLIVPFLSYVYLRKKNVSIFYTLVFILLIVSIPAWNVSVVGQFYMDRFYIGFIFIYLILFDLLINKFKDGENYNLSTISILIMAVTFYIFSAFMTERAMLMVAFASISLMIIFYKEIRKLKFIKYFLIISPIIFLITFTLYINFNFVEQPAAGSLNGIVQKLLNLNRFANLNNLIPLITFLVFNLCIIGFFSLFHSLRIFLLLVISLCPNLIYTVGGAELNGWYSHYHSMYLPFLIYFSILGYSNAFCNNKFKRINLLFLLSLFCILCLNIFDLNMHKPNFKNYKYGLFNSLNDYYIKDKKSQIKNSMNKNIAINNILPIDATISMPESGMPGMLNKNRKISLYPIGINKSDFLVLPILEEKNNSYFYGGASSYLGPENEIKMNECLNENLNKAGFDIDNPYFIIENTAVLKKN